ncbi:formyl transferase [Chloroflexota bacterium]
MTLAKADSTIGGSGGTPLRIVVLTYPCAKTLHLLTALADGGFAAEAVVVQQRSLLHRADRLARRFGIRSTLSIAVQRLKTEFTAGPSQNPHRIDTYRANTHDLILVRDLNSDETMAALERLAPDIGVVGCAGILRPAVFQSFRLGILNIHPGITPHYRGRSPLEWAVLEETQPGVTLHFIDAGVDTGPVVEQREVPVRPEDDFDSLYGRAYDVGIELLVNCLRTLARGDSLASVSQDWKHTRLRHSMPRRLRRVAVRRLREAALVADD